MATHGGAKLATRIAGTISRAIITTHSGLLGLKHKLAMAVFHSISDMISDEVHQTIGHTLNRMYDELPDDSPAKPYLEFMSHQHGQLQAAIGMAAGASGLTASLAMVMNNELAPSVYGFVGSNPHLIPDAGTIAQIGAKQTLPPDVAVNGMNQNGISNGWANAMVAAAQMYPGPPDILDLMRKGIIDVGTAYLWCQRNGMPDDVAAAYLQLKEVPITPADAALALLRGNIDQGTAETAAASYGLSAGDFNILVENTGEPPGVMQLLEAFRRGFIDEATLDKGILESRVRDEWISTLKSLAYSPMTVSDAVNAVVQGNLDHNTAEGYAQENGLEPGMFDVILATAGEPLSRTEMEDLYNRGLVTEAQVEQALSESRLKNKYNGLAFELHTRLMDPSTLSDAIVYGAIDLNTAVAKAMERGYSEADATTIVMSASNAKMFQYRTKVVENIVGLYEVSAMDQTTAIGYITALGWSEDEAGIILQSAQFDRQKRIQQSAINAVRSKFISHHISVTDMQTYLQEIGVPAGEIAYFTQIWSIEQSADVRFMTPMNVAKAVAATIMTQDDGIAYLVNLGYSPADAAILIQVAA